MTKDLQELISIIRNEVFTEERKVEQIQAILEKNSELVQAKNRYDRTPLYVASEIGQLEVVKALLAIKGIDVNAANNHGWTPLFLAVFRGHLSIIKVLLKHGADVNAATKNIGWTALGYAVQKGWSNPEYDNIKIIKVLLGCNNIDINIADKHGKTPLLTAVQFGKTEAVELLIQHTLAHDHKADRPDYLTGEYSNYWDKCTTKIEEMKKQKIGNSEVSFFDILVADKKELASYVKDYDVVKVLDAYECEKEFPIFAYRIKKQYTKGMNEKVAADIVLNLSAALNEYTSRMIFDHLDYRRIRDFCIAGHRNLIEKRHTNAEAAHEQLVEDDETISSDLNGIKVKEHGKSVTQQNKT